MSRIRLLHVHHGRVLGGAPISLVRLLSRLPADRFESHVVVPGPGPAADLFRRAGHPVHSIPLAAWYYLAHEPRVKLSTRIKHALLAPVTALALGRLLDRIQPDVVHLNCALLPVAATTVVGRHLPFVWHIREVIPDDDPASRDLLVDAARSATVRVAISGAAAAPFRPAGEVRVIHEGVDPVEWWRPGARGTTRTSLNIADDEVALLYAAGLSRHKGQMEFLEALPAALARVPKLRILMAGGDAEPAWAARVRRRATELGLGPGPGSGSSSRVAWFGWRTDLPDLLAAADIAAFIPTAGEGFGLPLIEAMAAGRALIGPLDPTGREIVADQVTGCLVRPGDRDALVAAIHGLANDPERRARFGAAARADVERRFTIGAMASAFGAVFEEAARSGPLSRSRL